MPNYPCAGESLHTMRPMSWHPGFSSAGKQVSPEDGVNLYYAGMYQQSETSIVQPIFSSGPFSGAPPSSTRQSVASSRSAYHGCPDIEFSSSDRILGNTIADLETLAVSTSGRQTMESCVRRAAAQERKPLNQAQNCFQPSSGTVNTFRHFESDSRPSFVQPSSHDWSLHHQLLAAQYPSSYDHCALAQSLVFPPNDYAIYDIPTSPDFLPIQYPADFPQPENIAAAGPSPPQRIATKTSKELVGMGLYDDKNGSLFSSLDHVGNGVTGLRDTLGKGLKLEETWKPPGNADEEDEADEGYSTDDAEEELPTVSCPQETRTRVLPVEGDLSNQTFFFDNDEQYGNCMVFNQGFSVHPSKAPDLTAGNSLWF